MCIYQNGSEDCLRSADGADKLLLRQNFYYFIKNEKFIPTKTRSASGTDFFIQKLRWL